MKNKQIETAKINWSKQGTPVSETFGDVYFSDENGLQEAQHVFLQGNNLPERFKNHNESQFIIAETGFGIGLNFLALCQCWQAFRRDNPENSLQRLTFISFEKYPLSLSDLIEAHKAWPELEIFAQKLHAQWPPMEAGPHRLKFIDEGITLELWLGDVNELMLQLVDMKYSNIDTWFLDGFSPTKNPDMWTDTLFNQIVTLSKAEGTFSTYTVAGFVRRGLKQAGFDVTKIKGFGRKKEMLSGKLNTLTAAKLK